MERKTYLNRYRLYVDRVGLPVVIRRSTEEATLRADDLESGAQVAVQIVPAPALSNAEREQLEAEARAAQQITHPNIPRLRDFGFDGDQLVYVTEFIEGITAEDWIKSKGPMPVTAVMRIASQMVSALVAASLHGVIHYAVYPANILLVPGETAEGEWPLVKVLNFLGVAPSLTPSNGLSSPILNPADFVSPEQLRDGPVTFRSEIYSLGCALWFLLKAQPFVGGPAALQAAIGLPAPVWELLSAMLSENPSERPADPLGLQQQIQACLAHIERQDVVASKWGLPIAAVPTPANEVEILPRRHSGWRALALAAVLVAIATLTAIILAQRSHFALATQPAVSNSEAPKIASIASAQPNESSALEKAPEPAALENKKEDSPANKIAASDVDSSAQATADNSVISKPRIEMMTSAPLNQGELQESGPVATRNSFSSDRGIAALELPLKSLPTPVEAPAPAEGPTEAEETSAEIPAPEPPAVVEEEVRKDNPPKPAPVTPAKSSKPARPSKPATKKAPVVAATPAPRSALHDSPRQYPPPMVGHLFPQAWPDTGTSESAASPAPREERESPRRPAHVPAKKKATASPAPPPA